MQGEQQAPPPGCDPSELLELHQECCELEYIIDSGYWVLPGDRVSLRDGRVGVVTRFSHILEGEEGAADGESYTVRVGEAEVQCAPDELTSLAVAAEAADIVAEAGAHSLTVARVLPYFRAGTMFRGDIAIPGDAGFATDVAGARQEYTLYIVGNSAPDALGNTRLRARHEAYGDEQSCDVTLRDSAVGGGVTISYCDNETFCEGRLHVDLGHDGAFGVGIAGDVKQLVQAQAGFWEPADEVTHTFRLGAQQPEAGGGGGSELARRGLARARVRLQERLQERLRACTALGPGLEHALLTAARAAGGNPAQALGDGPGAALSPAQRTLLAVRFGDLVRDSTRASEDECAAMRHIARVADALTFEDGAAKAAMLARLAAGGATRSALHANIDAVMVTLRAVLVLARFVLRPSMQDLGPAIDGMQNGHYRMSMNYERVDKSLGCAAKRLPLALVRSWRVPVEAADADEPCAICMTALTECEDPDFLKMPCGHAFHEDCVQGWLDNNPTCPNCRSELGAVMEAEDSAAGGATTEEPAGT